MSPLLVRAAELVDDVPGYLEALRPVVEFLVLAAAVVTAAAVLWTKFVGPFVARPIGTVIRNEVGEVVRTELKVIEGRLGRIEKQLSPIDDSAPLKTLVLDMKEEMDDLVEESRLDRSNLWRVLAENDIHDRRETKS